MLESAAFQIYVTCASVLILNLLFLANGTALNRARANRVLNPEDKRLNGKAVVAPIDEEGIVARYRRAHLNALENILPFLGIGFLLVLTDPGVAIAGTLLGAFTLFRVVHSVTYVKAVQPLRTISFAVSSLALVGVVVMTLVGVFTA